MSQSENWPFDEQYEIYKSLKGKDTLEGFIAKFELMHECLEDNYIWGEAKETGPQSREEAWHLWVSKVGKREAERVFDAVDRVTPYT